ncbi:MAG: hypothetical protein ACR2KT_10725 [Methylocella sp.]
MGVRIPKPSRSLAAAKAEPRPRQRFQEWSRLLGLRKLEVVAGLDEWLALARVP